MSTQGKCCVTYLFIPEQFTVKVQPALFEGEDGGEGGAKKLRNTFLS